MRYNKEAGGNKNVLTYATSVDEEVKAVSKGYTCAILYDASTTGS